MARSRRDDLFLKFDEYRIGLVGFLILMALTVVTGISVYVVMQHQAESILGKSLEASLKSSVDLFDNLITEGMDDAQMIATRPSVIDKLIQLNAIPGNIKSKIDLQRIAESFVSHGFSGVSFYDAQGAEVARTGRFLQQSALHIPINSQYSASLLWDGQFILHTLTDILDPKGRRIGTAMTEANLKLPAQSLADAISIGKTGEFALCGPSEEDPQDMDCFLNRDSGRKFQRVHRVVEDKALPMNYALDGKTGLIFAKDYRREKVVAAYAPLVKFGLGMVLKIDQTELYSPVTEKLKYIAALLLALIIFGGLLLHWIVTPLVRKLFNSRRELRLSKKRLEELLENMSSGVAVLQVIQDGTDFIFTNINRASERMDNLRREDLIGKRLTEVFPGSKKMGLIDAFRRVWQSGKAEHFPAAFYNDERISVWRENYIYKLDSGEIVAIYDDVTERKHAEEALQESQEKLHTIVDTALDAIVQMDSDGIITGWNIQAEKIFGWSGMEAIGQVLHETIIPLQYREAHIQGLKRFLVSGKGQVLNSWIEIQGLHRSGREFPIELAVVPFKLKGKYEFHAFIRNITERKQAELLIRMQSDALYSSTNGVAIADAADSELPLVYVNPAFEEITGYPASELLGRNCRFLQGQDRDQPGLAEIRSCLKEGRAGKAILRNYKKDGTLFWNRLSISPILDKEGKITQFLGIVNDITERKQTDDHLRLISGVFDHAEEGILITDQQGAILEANPACSRITGYSREEILGKNPRILHSGRQDQAFYDAMWREILENGHWSGEVWNRRKNGEIYPERLTLSAVKNEAGETSRYIALFSDISNLKNQQQQLERLAHHDALTGLPNRTLLNDRFEMALAQTKRSGGKLAACFMDLDGFKPVNDTFGHEAGDLLLVEVAQRMLAISRATDTVARLGGDEFVLIFPHISDEAECRQMLSRIMDSITQPFNINGHDIRISASIGVAFYPDDDADGDSLLRHADQAMYVAKQSGRNQFHFFDAATD